jgi:hypothetical protein
MHEKSASHRPNAKARQDNYSKGQSSIGQACDHEENDAGDQNLQLEPGHDALHRLGGGDDASRDRGRKNQPEQSDA